MSNETSYNVDEKTQTITEPEYRNLQGKVYSVTAEETLLDGETFYLHLTTGSKPVVAGIDPNSSGKFTYSLYEDQSNMDVSSNGTTVNANSFNRVTQQPHETSWQKNPTVNAAGSEIIEVTSSGASGATTGPLASDSTPGAVSRGLKWVLADNTEYLIEIVDQTSDSNEETANIVIDFMETDLNL